MFQWSSGFYPAESFLVWKNFHTRERVSMEQRVLPRWKSNPQVWENFWSREFQWSSGFYPAESLIKRLAAVASMSGFNGAAGFTPLKEPWKEEALSEARKVSMEQRVLPRWKFDKEVGGSGVYVWFQWSSGFYPAESYKAIEDDQKNTVVSMEQRVLPRWKKSFSAGLIWPHRVSMEQRVLPRWKRDK